MTSFSKQLLIALVSLSFAEIGLAQSRVVWLSLEMPSQPSAFAGALPADSRPGPGELARLWLVERLPGFIHEHDAASLARIEKLTASESQTFCYANALRTPTRAANAIFSEPVLHRLPSRLIVRADRQALVVPHLNAEGQVRLKSLVEDDRLQGAVTSLRNYGAAIDAVLSTASRPHRVTHYNAPSRMLMARHVDWIISEPATLAGILQSEPSLPRMATRSFEIAGPPSPVVTYVMCSRTKTARRLVDELNQLMTDRPDRPWERPYQDLLDARERSDLSRMVRGLTR